MCTPSIYRLRLQVLIKISYGLKATLKSFSGNSSPLPSVLYSIPSIENVSGQEIIDTIWSFLDIDDVSIPEFFGTLILQTPSNIDTGNLMRNLRLQNRIPTIIEDKVDEATELLPSGPYFLCGRRLHQAWRLYSDHLDAFVITDIPKFPMNSSGFVFPQYQSCRNVC